MFRMMISFMFIAIFIIRYLFLIFLLIKNQELRKVRSTILKVQHWFVSAACWWQWILKSSKQKNRKSVRLYTTSFEFFDFLWSLILFCRFHWSFKLKQLLVDKAISTSVLVFAETVSCQKIFFVNALILI